MLPRRVPCGATVRYLTPLWRQRQGAVLHQTAALAMQPCGHVISLLAHCHKHQATVLSPDSAVMMHAKRQQTVPTHDLTATTPLLQSRCVVLCAPLLLAGRQQADQCSTAAQVAGSSPSAWQQQWLRHSCQYSSSTAALDRRATCRSCCIRDLKCGASRVASGSYSLTRIIDDASSTRHEC